MEPFPIHKLEAKNLKRKDFDIILLDGKLNKDYNGVIPHRHNFYELLIFTEGGGIHEVDFKEYDIEKNSFHFISPDQVHRLKASFAKGYVFCFSEEFMLLGEKSTLEEQYPFYNYNLYNPFIKLPTKFFSDILENIRILENTFSKSQLLQDDIMRCYLQIILIKIKEYFLMNHQKSVDLQTSNYSKISEFKKLINKEYLNHYPSKKYAELLNITPNYLNALCKKETGKTAIQLIHERLLLEIKRLLYCTSLSAKEICFQLNFHDVANFNKFFKKNLLTTPLKYREQLKS